EVPGLRGRVEIIRDRWGVPHIYADNLRDLFFGNGYAQAQDRLWQMEFNRRLASGRLSEVLGPGALEVDRLMRRIGFRRAAERDWSEAEADERAVTEAFAAGVNACIEGGALPIEFTVLRFRPEPWSPVDTLAFGRFMSWTLVGYWDTEIVRSWTIERFGAEVMAELEPRYPVGGPVIVPPGTEAKGAGPDMSDDYRAAAEAIGVAPGAMSNNWAVDGHKSATGKPLLANDPHLPLTMPSIWWEVHLDSPEVKAAGAGLPGVAGVIIGHNDRIAWGITAAMTDGDDLFVERVNPDNPSQYEYKGEWADGDVVREEIKVRGRSRPVVEEVLLTRHGPVISPAVKGETRTLSLRTTGLEPWRQMRALLMLMGARNWDEFREATAMWPAPPQNFAYADVEGNIGYQLAGLVPIRAKGYGVVPVPGWTDEYEWTGFIPADELPFAYNPPGHWVASANNKIVDDDYPYFLSATWADSPRQRRIIELLEAKEKLSADDFKAMQGDQASIPARELVPLMLAVEPRDEWGRRALTFLRAWDQVVSADSVGACVFELFFTHIVRRAVEEKLGSWADFFMGKGIHPSRPNGLFFVDAASWLSEKMRERPDWFEGKPWRQAMEEALADAVAELRKLLGDDVSRWQWGRLHTQSFRHPLGGVKALSRVFNRGPVPMGGDANTVWQSSYAPYRGYEVNSFTASWRQIIDLADFNRSQAVIPTGQSGHPGSRHYSDMVGMWQRVEYHPMPWDREEVEKHARGRLELSPDGY
ncbi:MAG TPA: penicillin acylase family protein, partial [Dehalococcoidia bacterium]|nr:penicillin acylase family protein [Dehalococcoidia bacterium]